jgi:hypothetical protein
VQSIPGGQASGITRLIPSSEEMVAVTKKKMSSKNAMSAIDPAFTSGINFECLICIDLDVNVLNASQK